MNKRIQFNKTLLISERKIKRISGRSFKSKNAITIDGKGKFLIPGLWDMHVHTADSDYLKMFVINGVTGIRDMGGAAHESITGCESLPYKTLVAWRKLILSGSLIGPRMLISGPTVSNTGWPTSINIRTPKDARNAVKTLKSLGVDFIKVYENIPLDAYQTLASEAKAAGLYIAGHVPVETVSLREAAEAGHRSIEHIRDQLVMCFTDNRNELLEFFKKDNWPKKDIEWGLKQFEQCPNAIKLLKDNQTWLVPTLTVERAKIAVGEQSFVNDVRRKLLPQSVQEAFRDFVIKKLNLSTVKKKSEILWWLAQKRLVTRMHSEGVGFMAGTDCACEGGLPGYSLHYELQLLVESGFSPIEALQTATINPIKYLKMTDSLGTVEKGKIAELVILNQNPMKDISATHSIFAVILNGYLISKEQIDKLTNELKGTVNIR